ncbi:hypothetical protein ACHAWF_006373 [Thalassiosira exigua]
MFADPSAARGDGGLEMEPNDPDHDAPSAVGSASASAAASLARTVTSTIVDGVVHTVAHWRVLLLGQGVSLILAVAGGTNEFLAVECGVSAPSTYNAFGYSIIAVVGAFLHRRDTKKAADGQSTSREEQESFRPSGGADHEGDGDGHTHDEEDDLTVDEDSPTKRSIFSRRTGSAAGGHRARHLPSDQRSRGSKDKARPQYPFLCGSFTIHAKWYYYFAVAFIEAQAYYLIFLAFRYTSFTFVYVSDALAIPSAMIFTKIFMKRSYLRVHLLGGAICIAGIVVNTASDMTLSDGLEHAASAAHVKGDIFAIAGAVLLGLDDVLSEIIVTDYGGVTEMLFMKGLFGALISVVQLIVMEREGVVALFSKGGSNCELPWRMALFSVHVVTRALDVWGEMQFLFVSVS